MKKSLMSFEKCSDANLPYFSWHEEFGSLDSQTANITATRTLVSLNQNTYFILKHDSDIVRKITKVTGVYQAK